MTVGVLSFVPLAPWLIKNIVFFGAPLYPYYGVSSSNPTTADRLFVQSSPVSAGAHARWILTSLLDFIVNDVSVLAVVLVLAVVVLRRPAQRAALLSAAALLAFWFLYVPYFAPPRYYLGPAAILQALTVAAVYAVAAVYELWHMLRLPPRTLQVLLLLFLLLRAVYVAVAEYGLLSTPWMGQIGTGQMSRYDYLSRQVRGYQAEMWVDDHTPRNAEIAVVNVITGYYLDRPYLNDWYGSRFAQLTAGWSQQRAELALWCRDDVSYAVFDRGDGRPEQEGSNNGSRLLASFGWTHAPGLQVRSLYSARGVDVLGLDPCAAVGQRSGA
jgi:hypothetical protein